MSLETLNAITCTPMVGHIAEKFKEACALWEIESFRSPEGKVFEFRQFDVIELVDDYNGPYGYGFHSGNAHEYEVLVHMLHHRDITRLHLGVI